MWCIEDAWFAHSPQHDFHVKDAQGYVWGLPVLVPTCPKKLFALGPRKKYVDIGTDTLHASSSDLFTWNTLVMIKLGWVNCIPREWGEITAQSLAEWRERDKKPPFLSGNRKGYATVTPVALSRNGIPGLAMHTLDQYPVDGLGIYDDLESCSHFSGYVWSDWTTKTVQPMHKSDIDDALKAMIDQPVRSGASATMASSQLNIQSDSITNDKNKGSSVSVFSGAPPSPEASTDVSIEASVDKSSRESPDTTTKPDGKSLKTSEAASPSPARHDISESREADTHISDVSAGQDANPRPLTNRWTVRDVSEASLLTRQMHKRVPAWKLQLCIEALNARPIDLARITHQVKQRRSPEPLGRLLKIFLGAFSSL